MNQPSGQGLMNAIKRRAKPAVLFTRVPGSATPAGGWRKDRATVSEPLDVYMILEDEEMVFGPEGEKISQLAVFYNTDRKLPLGSMIRHPDFDKKFVIRKSVQRPATNPKYFKAWGAAAS